MKTSRDTPSLDEQLDSFVFLIFMNCGRMQKHDVVNPLFTNICLHDDIDRLERFQLVERCELGVDGFIHLSLDI
jgi:hypothetical protein